MVRPYACKRARCGLWLLDCECALSSVVVVVGDCKSYSWIVMVMVRCGYARGSWFMVRGALAGARDPGHGPGHAHGASVADRSSSIDCSSWLWVAGSGHGRDCARRYSLWFLVCGSHFWFAIVVIVMLVIFAAGSSRVCA